MSIVLSSVGAVTGSVVGHITRGRTTGEALGPEELTNGDFSSGLTGWTLANIAGTTGWRSEGTTAVQDASAGSARRTMRQDVLTQGRTYRVVIDAQAIDAAASLFIDCGVNAYDDQEIPGGSPGGVYTFDVVAANSTIFSIFGSTSSTGHVLNSVSVREVL